MAGTIKQTIGPKPRIVSTCNEKGHVAARCPKKRNQDRPWTPRSREWKDRRPPSNNSSKPSSFNTTQGKPPLRGGRTQSKGHLHQVEDDEENQNNRDESDDVSVIRYNECDQHNDFEFKCVDYCGGNSSRVQLRSVKPYMYRLTMGGQQVEFQTDTGASFIIISGKEYHKLCEKVLSLRKRLTKDNVILRSYE